VKILPSAEEGIAG